MNRRVEAATFIHLLIWIYTTRAPKLSPFWASRNFHEFKSYFWDFFWWFGEQYIWFPILLRTISYFKTWILISISFTFCFSNTTWLIYHYHISILIRGFPRAFWPIWAQLSDETSLTIFKGWKCIVSWPKMLQ